MQITFNFVLKINRIEKSNATPRIAVIRNHILMNDLETAIWIRNWMKQIIDFIYKRKNTTFFRVFRHCGMVRLLR